MAEEKDKESNKKIDRPAPLIREYAKEALDEVKGKRGRS